MLTRLAKLFLVLALACSIGLHWAALQTLAWTSMLTENLRQESLALAVERTFDGQHPCAICQAISAQQKAGKKNEAAPQLKSLEFPPASETPTFPTPRGPARVGPADAAAELLCLTPPSPPPRSFAV